MVVLQRWWWIGGGGAAEEKREDVLSGGRECLVCLSVYLSFFYFSLANWL